MNKLRSGCSTVQLYVSTKCTPEVRSEAAEITRRALGRAREKVRTRLAVATDHIYQLFFGGRVSGKNMSAVSGAVILRIGGSTEDTTVCWLSSMPYATRGVTTQYASSLGLLNGLAECARKR